MDNKTDFATAPAANTPTASKAKETLANALEGQTNVGAGGAQGIISANQPTPITVNKPQLPQGGGAIKGMGETFNPNPFSGTGSYAIPIPVTPARGFEPQLALHYNSGSGNGPFGIGFTLSAAKITRRTEKGIPQYNHNDIFIDAQGRELTPKLNVHQQPLVRTETVDKVTWQVHEYCPRVESDFTRLEYWFAPQTQQSHWRSVSGDNTTLIYGQSAEAQVYDPRNTHKIFEWLLEQALDSKGNKIIYHYKAEDDANVPEVSWEQHRALSQKYVHQVRYGNYWDKQQQEQFAFELLLDYGEYDLSHLSDGGSDPYQPTRAWAYRPDAFSSYRSGFEIRTRRRCAHILLFHHFPEELGAPCLVKALALDYQSDTAADNPAKLSLLQTVTLNGYQRGGQQASDVYQIQAMPTLKLTFSAFNPPPQPQFQPLQIEGEHDIPGYLHQGGFQSVDLNGEGIAGLVHQGQNSVYYLSPLGEGEYAAPQVLNLFPIDNDLARGGVMFTDLDSNGELQLVVHDPARTGYYQRSTSTGEMGWEPYQIFESYPIEYGNPQLETTDVDANGKTDLLLAQPDALTIYPSQGKAGYGAPYSTATTETFPLVKQGDPQEHVGFSSFLGDGLAHRVRIGNGLVECWPCLGYGHYGNKIILGNAPNFGTDFDASRLFLADVDGSGTTDLVYLHPDRVSLYLNQSGNGFADPIHVPLPVTYSSIDQVSFADVLGNGTTALVMSKIAPQPTHFYYNFVGTTQLDKHTETCLKPYLLTEIDNNLGALTQLWYTSSVQFYLADKKAGRPWSTKLPFPVQVLEKVVTHEQITGARFAQRFAYHDGFYDTVEREFCGFAYVETWDTETFTAAQAQEAKGKYVAPVYSRSWYHTGHVGAQAQDAYYHGDPQAQPLPQTALPTPCREDAELQRQAWLALKGQVLRQEVYAEDDSPQAANPYVVSESAFALRMVQARHQQPYAVFLVLPRESQSYHYERNPADPRIERHFALQVDEYGHVTRAAQAFLPRRTHGGTVYPAQHRLKIVVSEDRFINHDGVDFRLLGVPCEMRTFELGGALPTVTEQALDFERVAALVEQGLQNQIDHAAVFSMDVVQARLLTWHRSYFWNAAQTQALLLGEITAQALLHHQAGAAFTQTFIDQMSGKRLSTGTLTQYGGYVFEQDNGHWWNYGLVQYYETAKRFFVPCEVVNSYAKPGDEVYARTTYVYDDYALHPRQVSEYVDADTHHTTQFLIDYHTCQVQQVMDVNDNVAQVLFDPLGQVVVGSVFGKQQGQLQGGMRLLSTDGQAAEYQPHQWKTEDFAALLAKPEDYLQGALSFFYYDVLAWQTRHQPSGAIALAARDYFHGGSSHQAVGCHVAVSYHDGLGRALVEKVKSEAGQWRTSGQTVYNNKGKPYLQYLPYFSATPDYQVTPPDPAGPPPTVLLYDPLQRVIQTITPKGLFSKVEFDPWQVRHFDEDDTVKESEYYQRFLRDYPAQPTQAQQNEKAALEQAARFYDTPNMQVMDNTGKPFLEIALLGEQGLDSRQLITFYRVDILGRVVEAIDPRLYQSNQEQKTAYYNFKYWYTMDSDSPLYTDSVDAGKVLHLHNIYGLQLWTLNARNYCQLISYDALQRKHAVRVKKIKDKTPQPITTYDDFQLVEVYTYGESQQDAAARNLRGQLYELKDLSGVVWHRLYDIQGRVLQTGRRMVKVG